MTFEPNKESAHILCPPRPSGPSFRVLGVQFDCQLRMHDDVAEPHGAISWKVRTLDRARRYYNEFEIMGLYKTHMLSFVEYRTPAIYNVSFFGGDSSFYFRICPCVQVVARRNCGVKFFDFCLPTRVARVIVISGYCRLCWPGTHFLPGSLCAGTSCDRGTTSPCRSQAVHPLLG